jgi:hypothetical protein
MERFWRWISERLEDCGECRRDIRSLGDGEGGQRHSRFGSWKLARIGSKEGGVAPLRSPFLGLGTTRIPADVHKIQRVCW